MNTIQLYRIATIVSTNRNPRLLTILRLYQRGAEMIRTHSGDVTYSDLHDHYKDRREEFLDWLQSAARAFQGVAWSEAAVMMIEQRLGRGLSSEAQVATAYIVNVCIDIENKLRGEEARSYGQIGLDNAAAIAKTNAIKRHSSLSTHEAAQIAVVWDHIDKNHLN